MAGRRVATAVRAKARAGGGQDTAVDTTPDVSNLAALVEDSRQAGLDGDPGPSDPSDFHSLTGRLVSARAHFPPVYTDAVVDPFLAALQSLGQQGFTQILMQDPRRVSVAGTLFDITQAILQRGEGFEKNATDAFQEVVGDLYDGFLSAEDRKGVAPPENATVAPLIKWGNPADGPYTWPIDATHPFGLKCGAIVNLPPSHSRRGIIGWAALGHETGGHDILHAYAGMEDQLAGAVFKALKSQSGLNSLLPNYWASRIDETASDVMGILNMGPAAAIGVIGYFRGLNAAFGGSPSLRNEGQADDPHPADIVRGYLASSVVSLLSFDEASAWSEVLKKETDNDLDEVVLEGQKVSQADAQLSAQVVAETVVRTQLLTLESHALGDIQDWRNQDEQLVVQVRQALGTAGALPADQTPRIFAAHVVAGALMEILAGRDAPDLVFERMKSMLDVMHKANPTFGPLFVRHRGNIFKDVAYRRYIR